MASRSRRASSHSTCRGCCERSCTVNQPHEETELPNARAFVEEARNCARGSSPRHVLETRGRIGATLNRLDTTEQQITDLEVSLETERMSLEDIDVAEAATRLARYGTTHQASLAVSARVMQPSLLDFLS